MQLGVFVALLSTFGTSSQGQPVDATLRIRDDVVIASIPSDFIGLSFETLQLNDPHYFSAWDKALVGLFRRLTRHGILRIGGNTSEYSQWMPNGKPSEGQTDVPVGRLFNNIPPTYITPETLRELHGFLRATGWKLIYGLNLGTGTPEQAAAEAEAVTREMGSDLVALQIGNEPDLFSSNGLRTTYTFEDFFKEWKAFYTAIKSRVPKAIIAGPDSCWDWVPNFVERISKKDVHFLSSHFYYSGPPTDPKVKIDSLLSGNGWYDYNIDRDMKASRKIGLPFRNTECNSCYRGGKAGVSDTFASALWSAEFCLMNASRGAVGVTFHGGVTPIYTEIAGDPQKGFTARPDYYGILFADQFVGSTLVACDFDPHGLNASAYAAKKGSRTLVAIFNKDRTRDLEVYLDSRGDGEVWRLSAPALDSKSGVSVAGCEVSAAGGWLPRKVDRVLASLGRLEVSVPHGSAALVFLEAADGGH
jgi:hypothetical protein